MSEKITEIFEGNKSWSDNVKSENPEFFENLAKGQQPEYLWIGCSDSRVPATQVTQMNPGNLFVHRNIANVINTQDTNALSVIYYAVMVLKVKHVLIVGHYGCGGVQAAMSNNSFGYIDNWLINIKDVYRKHASTLDGISDESERFTRFVELNVKEQVNNLAKVPFMQEAWKSGGPHIHGLVYDLASGTLNDLGVSINSADGLEKVYKYD